MQRSQGKDALQRQESGLSTAAKPARAMLSCKYFDDRDRFFVIFFVVFAEGRVRDPMAKTFFLLMPVAPCNSFLVFFW